MLYQGGIDKLLLSAQAGSEIWELKTNNYSMTVGKHKPIEILENKGRYQFNKSDLREVLKEITEKNIEIQSLASMRPSLEEIIYKIKS